MTGPQELLDRQRKCTACISMVSCHPNQRLRAAVSRPPWPSNMLLRSQCGRASSFCLRTLLLSSPCSLPRASREAAQQLGQAREVCRGEKESHGALAGKQLFTPAQVSFCVKLWMFWESFFPANCVVRVLLQRFTLLKRNFELPEVTTVPVRMK